MAQLLVFGVDSPQTAEKIMDMAGDLAKQELLELADAAWVERTPDGQVKIHQSVNLTATLAGTGAFNPTVIQTNLSKDSERELIEALHGSQQVGADSQS